MKIIVNAGSGNQGGEALCERLEELFQAEPGELAIHLVHSGEELEETAKQAAEGDDPVVVAVGGDGTISAVAGFLVGTDKTLGVLPGGTLNHFAKDMRIPLDLQEAAKVIREGNSALVDTGEVNGRVFLNNSSVGIYPLVVRGRDERQRKFNHGKWSAFARAAFETARRFPVLELALAAEGKHLHRRTPFLFVGNNRYELETARIGTRQCIDCGELSFFVAHQKSAFSLFLLALRALFGRLHAGSDFDSFCAAEAVIKVPRHHVTVATDGEIQRMSTPLNYRVVPKSLRVFVPARKLEE